MKTVGLMLALLAVACAATPRATSEWVKQRESAEDLERAKTECRKRALAATASEYNQSVATKAALGVYIKCMEDKGWTQVQQSPPAPASSE